MSISDHSLIADDSQHEVPSFERHRAASTTVRLNVGGKVFHASWQLLLQVPESRLGEQTLLYPSSVVFINLIFREDCPMPQRPRSELLL